MLGLIITLHITFIPFFMFTPLTYITKKKKKTSEGIFSFIPTSLHHFIRFFPPSGSCSFVLQASRGTRQVLGWRVTLGTAATKPSGHYIYRSRWAEPPLWLNVTLHLAPPPPPPPPPSHLHLHLDTRSQGRCNSEAVFCLFYRWNRAVIMQGKKSQGFIRFFSAC